MDARYETHVFSYRHAGTEWQLKIDATDADDARERIGKLAWATYDGVALSEQPIVFAPLGIASVWVRNFVTRLIKR
jgi:hypothetical protein